MVSEELWKMAYLEERREAIEEFKDMEAEREKRRNERQRKVYLAR